ncbi:hypothetical protein ACEQ8H_003222 [Pleosporales sp. CAS-2024a]
MPQLSISPVLREAIELKIDELTRTKDDFRLRYELGIVPKSDSDTVARVKRLIKDMAKFNPELDDDNSLKTMACYVEKAANDRHISTSKFLKLEEQLYSKLNKHVNGLEVSVLHAQLLREALDAERSPASAAVKLEHFDFDDDFEVVEQELDDVLERFERDTFAAEEVDVAEIETYLSALLDGRQDKWVLGDIRDDLQSFEASLLTNGLEIDQGFLISCICDILRNGVITEGRRRVFEDYLQSPIAMRELVSTLNTKSVRHWDYKNAERGLPVTAFQTNHGHHRIAIEEDIIDSLFLHIDFVEKPYPLPEEMKKREYFLLPAPLRIKKAGTTCTICHPHYPPAPMPPPPPMDFTIPPPPPPPPPPMDFTIHPPPPVIIRPLGQNKLKKKKIKKAPVWAHPPPPPPPPPPPQFVWGSVMIEEVQAELLKTLTVERRLRRVLDGRVSAGSALFTSLAGSLPHRTILTILQFLGVGKVSLGVFERFLSVKLNIGPVVRGAPDRTLPRARGVSEGHSLEIFFTEAVMFFLELSVSKKTESTLYRLKDTCYFVGTDKACKIYEDEVVEFATIMGLDVELEDTQSIGFVDLDTGLDMKKVVAYARQIKKQLQVRVWNSTAGAYSPHLFGPPANAFGKKHHENVKSAYHFIHHILFDGGSLVAHLKRLLEPHLDPKLVDSTFSIEALIYMPQAYGGLGVKNPFILLNLAAGLLDDPDAVLRDYLQAEDVYYKRAAANYALLDADKHARKLEAIFNHDKTRMDAALGADRDLSVFMTKEELVCMREQTTYSNIRAPAGHELDFEPTKLPSLAEAYRTLLEKPADHVPWTENIREEVNALGGKGDMKSWRRSSTEDRWVLQLYGDECSEKFGRLEIWASEHVPQEVLKMARGTAWDDDDDGSSSISDLTEP